MSHGKSVEKTNQTVFTVGLTGSIGAGKSTVGHLLSEAGFKVVDADLLARTVLYLPETKEKLLAALGPEILDGEGEIDRTRIAGIVFQQPEKRSVLNSLIHPGVRKEFKKIRDSLPAGSVLVYDVPLLFETGLEKDFDLTIVVNAPQDQRMERTRIRNGWDQDEFLRRNGSQMKPEEKEKRADVVLINDSGEEELKEKVEKLVGHILARKDRV